jgi:hypothetical protein
VGKTLSSAKVLLYDLETSYLITKNWGIWEQNVIGAGKGVLEDFQILCFAYKWLGDKHTHVVAQPDFKGYKPGVNDDKNVVKALWELFDEADITIAHNGNQFDYRKSTARFIYHKLPPPSPTQQIDTKLVARRHFGFTSNKLDDLAHHFGIPGKLDAGGIETWDGCIAGDMKAWKRMTTYNKRDVVVLEKVYLKMRAWQTNHPNMGAYIIQDRPVCPRCQSSKLHGMGFKTTVGGIKYRRWQCQECGHYSSDRTIDKSKPKPEIK